LVLALAAALTACGEDDETPGSAPTFGPMQDPLAAEGISFGESLAQIRGHHAVALELYAAGDEKGALVHAGHPIAEIFDLVAGDLEEHDQSVADQLQEALEDAEAAVAEGRPQAVVETAFDHVAHFSDAAALAVVGDRSSDPAYQGSVIAALLGTAGHEYEEAVGPEGLRLLVEYQDGYGFVQEARRLYEGVEADVEAASAEEAEEIDEAFETLSDALPAVEPPRQLADPLDVEAAAELIGHELEETVGAQPLEEADAEEVVEEIEELLTEIEETYAEGDADAAAELSAEAYLENYEVIEADVIELAPDVNEELEPLLGAELRRQIQAGAPQEDIESMIDRARELLDEALEALEAAH
jgi:hypothetical protein